MATSNELLALAGADHVVPDRDDVLAPTAVERVLDVLDAHPDTDFLYSDEDHLDARGRTFDPVFKPDWSPERFRSQMYTNHFAVVRRGLAITLGGFRPEYEGSQDYDLILRITEQTDRIVHIPEILYHWRVGATSTSANDAAKPWAFQAGVRCRTTVIAGIEAKVEPLGIAGLWLAAPDRGVGTPTVSAIIPTRQRRTGLGVERTFVTETVRHVFERATSRLAEVIVAANADTPPSVLDSLAGVGRDQPFVILDDRPFNFSERINLGAAHASGEYLLLLNDDIDVVTPDFLETMLALAQADDVGMVGAKLLYADGTLQHGGHVYTGIPMHAFLGRGGDEPGPMGMLLIDQEVSGVTAACALVKASVFDAVGGFSPSPRSTTTTSTSPSRCGALVTASSGRLMPCSTTSRRRAETTLCSRPSSTSCARWEHELSHDPYHHLKLLRYRDDWAIPYG